MTEKLMAAQLAHSYRVFLRPFELNIIGVRSSDPTPNKFNDRIYALCKDEQGKWQELCFTATTDPGLYWLQHPLNVEGTAILKAGQYLNSHVIGLHRNEYTALVQHSPLTVMRDADRNGTLNFNGKEDTGMFGINIHRANAAGTTSVVDKYSAGCQVFANADDFHAFIELCERHKALYGNSFTYTLLHENTIA